MMFSSAALLRPRRRETPPSPDFRRSPRRAAQARLRRAALLVAGFAVWLMANSLRADDQGPADNGQRHGHQHDALPDLDRRLDLLEGRAAAERQNPAAAQAREARARAELILRDRLPGLQLDRHRVLGSPQWVSDRDGFLTGANGAGRGLSARGAAAAAARPDDPHRVTKAFLNEHAAIFGHDATALEQARISRDYVTAHNGMRTTVWQQQHDGLEIFHAIFLSHSTRQQELINVSSQFIPDPARAAGQAAPKAEGPGPAITAEQAIRLAARSLGQAGSDEEPVSALGGPEGRERRQTFGGGFIKGEALTRILWLPVDADTLRLCWRVLLKTRDSKARYRVLVDAETGEIWTRHNLTTDLTPASYRVFTSDSPTPFSPGYATPGNTNQPAQVNRQLVTLSAFNTNASPNGWINDGGNETRGNNIDAHTDTNADDQPDTPRPQGSPQRVFDPPLDLTQAPSTYRDAAVVNLFYWCNWMHDRLWELGFTEDAGNFQNDNFGRGGVGNDAVMAQAQDGDGSNNANFSYTDSDGERCYLQMFLWTGPNPDRDGDFEMEVILHEYTHGLSQRLVGGGVGLYELQSKSMGEGWSDFFGLALLSQAGDDHDGVFARGAYSRYQLFPGFMENYYYGARFYPYSTDMSKNALTFNDLDPAQRDLPSDVPSHPYQGGSYGGIHDYGSMWAVTLWDARVNLIKKHGFATGNQLILQLVVDGMKLSPPNPDYIQARDAILQADLVLTGGQNQRELWKAFAKRGLGREASSPGNFTTTGVVENFDSDDALRVITPIPLSGEGPVGGPFDAPAQNFTLQNTGAESLIWSVRIEPPLESTTTLGSLSAGASRTVSVTLDANAAAFFPIGTHALSIVFSNHVSHESTARTYQLKVYSDAPPVVEAFDNTHPFDLSGQQLTFTPDGPDAYQICRDTVASFPMATTSATTVRPEPNGHISIPLGSGQKVTLFGRQYSTVYLRNDGALSLTEPTSAETPSLATFFQRPGVAALFRDLSTNAATRISYEQRSDRFVATWDKAIVGGTTLTNQLQLELFFDGVIRITTLRVDGTTGLTGLSPGGGLPGTLRQANFSALSDCDTPPLQLKLPASFREGPTPRLGVASVFLNRARSTPTVVYLSSSDTTELIVPTSVVIPARETNAPIDLSVIDDSLRDGSQLVYVQASAFGFVTAVGRTRVDDNEDNPLTVQIPTFASEGQGAFAGTVSVPALVAGTVAVQLESSRTNELTVPPVVFIPAGQTSVAFTGQVIDDRRIDGNTTVSVTATVPNWTPDSDAMAIFDNEDRLLRMSAPPFITEGSGALTNVGRVYLSGTLETNLTIQLWSSNFFALFPSSPVTIPAGQTNAPFTISVGDNADIEGLRIVTLAATSPPFSNGFWNVFLFDNDQPPEPANPHPPHESIDWPLDTHLAWDAAEGELLVNGGFETGDFTGWTADGFGGGGWMLNDGALDPDSPDGPRPPLGGSFSAMSIQNGNGRRRLYQDVTLPGGATSGTLLRWREEIRNHAGAFAANQRFAVELRDPATGDLLATLHSTATNDPAFGGPTNRSVSVAAWRGQRVRVQFVEEDALGDLNVHLDDISLIATSAGQTTYDVYFGYDTVPDATEYQGSTTNAFWDLPRLAGGLYHYWRVDSRRQGITNTGPIWRFRTAGSSVATVPLAFESAWKYLASGANLGTTWRTTNYNDAIWPTGTAPLGFGSSQITTIGAASNDVTTFYFRRRLHIADTNRLATVTASLKRDDGAIVYVNGVEAFRDNMPAGRFDYLTQASSIVTGADETNAFSHPVNPALFIEGTNIIAVEVHQRDNGGLFPGPSPDLFFDLALNVRTNTGNLAPLAVNWIEPADFALVRTPTNLALRASVIDDNLFGARLSFYADGALLAEDAITPFAFTWTNPPPGLRTLLAVVTDPGGLVRTSAPLHVYVAPLPGQSLLTLVAQGSTWRYRQNGQEPTRDWTTLAYREPSDRSWAGGPAQLGYGDGDEATEFDFGLMRGIERNEWPITAYFRQTFQAGANLGPLTLRVLRDDGVAVYLNGAEVYRNNLPGGVLRSNTLAVAAIQPPFENTWLSTSLPASALAPGANVIAAEVHQSSAASGDLSFDLELSGTGNVLPAIALTSPAGNTSLLAPASVALAAAASDPYGAVTNVQFLRNGTLLGQDATAPHQFTWNNPPPGIHVLTAVATDNLGATSVSSPVTLTIVPLVTLSARALGTNVVELSWPDTAPGYIVEATASLLAPTLWAPISTPVTNSNGAFRVLVSPDDTQRYFRLRAP